MSGLLILCMDTESASSLYHTAKRAAMEKIEKDKITLSPSLILFSVDSPVVASTIVDRFSSRRFISSPSILHRFSSPSSIDSRHRFSSHNYFESLSSKQSFRQIFMLFAIYCYSLLIIRALLVLWIQSNLEEHFIKNLRFLAWILEMRLEFLKLGLNSWCISQLTGIC